MKHEISSFRHGEQLIAHWPEWAELQSVIQGIKQEDVLRAHREDLGGRPVGAQKAFNLLFHERLTGILGWRSQVLVFPTPASARVAGLPAPDPPFPERKIDFMKNHLGLEVVFNNESYLERILFRLNVASESDYVIAENEVVAGVIVLASEQIKRWGGMDPSVATFEGAVRTIGLVRQAFSVPLLLVGLFPDDVDWPRSSADFGRGRTVVASPELASDT
jgi:hypothetical protein